MPGSSAKKSFRLPRVGVPESVAKHYMGAFYTKEGFEFWRTIKKSKYLYHQDDDSALGNSERGASSFVGKVIKSDPVSMQDASMAASGGVAGALDYLVSTPGYSRIKIKERMLPSNKRLGTAATGATLLGAPLPVISLVTAPLGRAMLSRGTGHGAMYQVRGTAAVVGGAAVDNVLSGLTVGGWSAAIAPGAMAGAGKELYDWMKTCCNEGQDVVNQISHNMAVLTAARDKWLREESGPYHTGHRIGKNQLDRFYASRMDFLQRQLNKQIKRLGDLEGDVEDGTVEFCRTRDKAAEMYQNQPGVGKLQSQFADPGPLREVEEEARHLINDDNRADPSTTHTENIESGLDGDVAVQSNTVNWHPAPQDSGSSGSGGSETG